MTYKTLSHALLATFIVLAAATLALFICATWTWIPGPGISSLSNHLAVTGIFTAVGAFASMIGSTLSLETYDNRRLQGKH